MRPVTTKVVRMQHAPASLKMDHCRGFRLTGRGCIGGSSGPMMTVRSIRRGRERALAAQRSDSDSQYDSDKSDHEYRTRSEDAEAEAMTRRA